MKTLALFAVRAALLGAALAASLVAPPAHAQWRYVVVNGQRLDPAQVAKIEALYCSPIANGRYWYDTRTGIWGYEGDPRPRGVFTYRCGQVAQGNGGRSLSERGLLYSTHEILSGRR